MNCESVWAVLLDKCKLANTRLVSTSDVDLVCASKGFTTLNTLQVMVRKGYLMSTFVRGTYVVKTPDEYLNKYLGSTTLDLVVDLLNYKYGSEWYFGLSTALYLNKETWQTPRELVVVTNRVKPHKTEFMGYTLTFRNLDYSNFNNGVLNLTVKNTVYRYSSVFRTLLDYCYYYLKNKKDYSDNFSKEWVSEFRNVAQLLKKFTDYPNFEKVKKTVTSYG